MEPIRILQIVPNMQAGGLESLIMNIYRKIDRNKVQFDFIVHYKEKKHFDNEIENLGGKIYRFSLREDYNLIRYIKDLDAFFKKNKEYKVIHCHMSSIGFLIFLIAKKNGVKVRIAHSHNSATPKNLKGALIRLLMLPYKYFSTINYACSYESGRYLYNKKTFEIIQNGIDLEKYKFNYKVRNEIRAELNIDDEFIVGHVGRFNIQKNHKYLINMFSELIKVNPKCKLLLIGDGELNSDIKRQISQLGISDNVIMLGVRDDIHKLYQAMDCFCLPSISEGLPLVGVEAQASGLPCYFSDTITKELALTDNIQFLDLSRDYKNWIENIINNSQYELENRYKSFEVIENTNFNIYKLANYMENKYITLYK